MAPALPPCGDGTAYASLLTEHLAGSNSTYTAKHGSLKAQLSLLIVLVRSVRRWERRCRRDFVLLLGSDVHIPETAWSAFADEGVITHSTPPLFPGVPSADKLEAWRLTQYRKIAVLDSDLMALGPLDELFERDGNLTIANHVYDLAQGPACGVGPSRRGVAALFTLRPSDEEYGTLRRWLASRSAFELQHFSEQTALVCHFATRGGRHPAYTPSRTAHASAKSARCPLRPLVSSPAMPTVTAGLDTLPCSFLYDVGTPRHLLGNDGWKSCRRWTTYGHAACDAAARRSRECTWRKVRLLGRPG